MLRQRLTLPGSLRPCCTAGGSTRAMALPRALRSIAGEKSLSFSPPSGHHDEDCGVILMIPPKGPRLQECLIRSLSLSFPGARFKVLLPFSILLSSAVAALPRWAVPRCRRPILRFSMPFESCHAFPWFAPMPRAPRPARRVEFRPILEWFPSRPSRTASVDSRCVRVCSAFAVSSVSATAVCGVPQRDRSICHFRMLFMTALHRHVSHRNAAASGVRGYGS